MIWLFFALLPRSLWAVNNVVDKVLLVNKIRSPLVYLFLTAIVGLAVLFIVPFKGLVIPPVGLLFITLFAGVLYIYALLPYYKSLTLEEASRSVSLWHMTPIFVLIISSLTIGENLNTNDYIAFVLLVIGSILISIKKMEGKFRISTAFWLMLASCFIFAVENVLAKYIYSNIAYFDAFIWLRIGSFIGVLPFLLYHGWREQVFGTIRTISSKVRSIVLGNEFINLGAIASLEYAISTGSVSLVSALNGTQSLFLLIYVIFLSARFPRLLQEELKRSVLLIKIIAIILIIAGVYFISKET